MIEILKYLEEADKCLEQIQNDKYMEKEQEKYNLKRARELIKKTYNFLNQKGE